MSEWSDAKRWWAGLIKSILSFAIAAWLGFSFACRLEDERQKESFKWQAIYGVKVEVLRSFEQESKKYILAGHDAIREYACDKNRYTSKIIEQWEDERFDALKIAKESLEFWFASSEHEALTDALNHFAAAQDAIKGLRTGYLTDCKTESDWRVKMYLDRQWEAFDEKQFKPLRKAYHDSIKSILQEAALLL